MTFSDISKFCLLRTVRQSSIRNRHRRDQEQQVDMRSHFLTPHGVVLSFRRDKLIPEGERKMIRLLVLATEQEKLRGLSEPGGGVEHT